MVATAVAYLWSYNGANFIAFKVGGDAIDPAAVLAVATGATGVADHLDLANVPAPAWWTLAYLVVASTLVGYAVFLAVNADYAAPIVALLPTGPLPAIPAVE